MSYQVVQAHPNVPPFVLQTAQGYHERGMLNAFMTTFMEHQDYFLSKFILRLYPALRHELSRRSVTNLPIEKIVNAPVKEIIRTFSSRYLSAVTTDRIWEWAETSFDQWVADQLTPAIDAVHCYEHAGLATLRRAKELGILSIYEQPSQHHAFFSRIVQDQIKRYPELTSSITKLQFDEKARRRNQRRDQELRLADLVLCNSRFTKKTLEAAGIGPSVTEVIPYGFPAPLDAYSPKQHEKVIFLNAGTQNLRKALHLLYRAWRTCNFSANEAELWLIGKMNLPEVLRKDLPGRVMIKDSIPRSELMELYRQASVFVLPTLADGFGMVITEAMSRGVPVITTENSGGPDVIDHEENGFIIPAGQEEALVKQMQWCVRNKHLLNAIGGAAWEKAASWQWADYRKSVSQMVQQKIQQRQYDGKQAGSLQRA